MSNELREQVINKLELLGAYADNNDADELINLILDEAKETGEDADYEGCNDISQIISVYSESIDNLRGT